MRKPTIKDIAIYTGLSKGTVDRVLHKRGEVSRESFEKVMAAVKELGYEPNVYASLLAKTQDRMLAVLLPAPEKGSYWELAARGLERAMPELKALGASVRLFTYDQYSEEEFRSSCQAVLDSAPAGVLIAPLFKKETLALTAALEARDIPFGYVDTKLDESRYLVYFGIPTHKSGFFCADILIGAETVKEVLIVRVRRDKMQQADPTVYRRAGFMAYLEEYHPDTQVHQLFIDPSTPEETVAVLQRFFAEHPDLRHIVMFNSRVHLLVPFLERHSGQKLRVIGFDDIEANVAALKRGMVSMLIAQRPDQQVERALKSIAEYIVLRREPMRQNNFMHMLLLTRHNLNTE